MCGLTGVFQPTGFAVSTCEGIVRKSAENLSHRGPDDGGTWVDGDAGIALGHRRLSILDLSPAGHQPMISASGRYVIAFNGEIYNHLEIRKELEVSKSPPAWRGRSDTETVLSGFDRWGIDSLLKKTVGMFAFALWDRQERMLTLARDRVGEKPLYYGWQGNTFLFGSELKALRAHPAFRADIDRNVLALYLRHGYIAAPYSIYKNIFKLLPGAYLQLSAQQSPGTLPTPRAYWSLREVVERGLANPFAGSDEDAIGELESRLMRAVSLQRVADVPLGAFLSGGIDSSTIVALMQAQSTLPVKTFTIGFHEQSYNEAEHARSVAQHLGTEHTELYVTPRDAMQVIPKLPTLYDEPFGDSSAIPTFLVSQLARRHVTVSLSGDGGDELFGGYDRYQRTQSLWSAVQRIPPVGRRWLAGAVAMLPVDGLNLCLNPIVSREDQSPGDRVRRLALYLSAGTMEQFYQVQVSQRNDSVAIVLGDTGPLEAQTGLTQWSPNGQLYERMMYADAMSYLPDDILVKVDRAAMSVSLETRVPMLDPRVVEFAWRLPLHTKVRHGKTKWLLREVLFKHVPRELIERPKKGFGVPVGRWMRGPLRDWAEDLLSKQRLATDGFLNPGTVRKQWRQHRDGKANWGDSLWTVLMFQAWLCADRH